MIRAVVRSPFTEPSFLISIRSFARRLPFTLPYTTTSRAMISAVTFAEGPTVSFRSSRVISPSTDPSINRSSLPEISPFTCRLAPRRAVARSAVAPNGRIASVLIAGLSSQVAEAGFDGLFVAKFLYSGCPACGASGFLLPHIVPPKGTSTPRRIPAGVLQTVFPGSVRGKQSVSASFQTVTRLWDRRCRTGWAVRKDCAGIRTKCKAECGAGGWSVCDSLTTHQGERGEDSEK